MYNKSLANSDTPSMVTTNPSTEPNVHGIVQGMVTMANKLVATVNINPNAMFPLACPVRMTPLDIVVGPKKKMANPKANSVV